MVTRSEEEWQTVTVATRGDWKQQLREAIDDPDELITLLQLPDSLREPARRAARLFPLKVPRAYVERIEPGNPEDPLLRQVLPLAEEADPAPGYGTDPLQERDATPMPGVLHKYANRVLVVTTGACAIHCRYCFRRHFPYADSTLSAAQVAHLVNYLQRHPDVDEVILSGGDPLALSDPRLSDLFSQLGRLPQISVIRIHSRLPVFIPERLDKPLIDLFAGCGKPVVLVFHVNHPREISESFVHACGTLRKSGVTLLNQAVLLRGVNTTSALQIELSKRLFRAGILPYYLHLPDPVAGTAHFSVNEVEGTKLMAEMRAALPGYLVPRLVREIPGQAGKTPVG